MKRKGASRPKGKRGGKRSNRGHTPVFYSGGFKV